MSVAVLSFGMLSFLLAWGIVIRGIIGEGRAASQPQHALESQNPQTLPEREPHGE